jgi:GNAT superfamily N-acetyltransferase
MTTLSEPHLYNENVDIVVTSTPARLAGEVAAVIASAYRIPLDIWNLNDDCITEKHVRQQVRRFPEGQFVALRDGQAVGMASTMRTHRSPYEPALTWMEQIGDLGISAHAPDGDWLYGVEFAVNPAYRKQGIGSKLYRARFDMIRRLNQRGFHMVGMLMGYRRYDHLMSVREYGLKVIYGELSDPTVTMQMNRGFRPLSIVENYLYEEDAGNAGVHMVWLNPERM